MVESCSLRIHRTERRPLNAYCNCKPVADAEYGSESDEPPVEVIIEALAEATGGDPVDLPSLFDFIDPDAVNQLFMGHDTASHADTILSFRFETWNVYIYDDGRIRVCDSTQSTNPEPIFESTPA